MTSKTPAALGVKMEAPRSDMLLSDGDERNLLHLLDAFGSTVVLQDIASAYHEAGHDVYAASEILRNLQKSSCSSNSSLVSKDELEFTSASSESSSDIVWGKSDAGRYSSAPKPKQQGASMGTVSSVIGAEYSRSRPSANGACEVPKPMKLMSSEIAVSESWDGEVPLDTVTRTTTMQKDVEKFLFSMLGDGFQVDMNVIKEVLGTCGYDVRKSMDKLLSMTSSSLEINDCNSRVADQTKQEDLKSIQYRENLLSRDFAGSGDASLTNRDDSEPLARDRDRYDLQKEVLTALFTVRERCEQRILPKKEVKSRRPFGQVVAEPPKDIITEFKNVISLEVNGGESEESEDSYELLRKAVMVDWGKMKAFYKAAADEYAKGNDARAFKFMEQGHFFMDKARETNEKSAQKLTETRNDEDILSIDLQDCEPKEAIRLLKQHLTNISGISCFRYLKIIVANDVKSKEGACKRWIKKLLEKDSIAWTEEGDGRIMLIRVDEIDPKRLSFAKK